MKAALVTPLDNEFGVDGECGGGDCRFIGQHAENVGSAVRSLTMPGSLTTMSWSVKMP